MLPLIRAANKAIHNIAIYSDGNQYTYEQLLHDSASLAYFLLGKSKDLHEERVAFMVDPGYEYVVSQWAIWRAGGIAVPVCISYPLPSIKYVLEDTGAKKIICGKKYNHFFSEINDPALVCIDVDTVLTLPHSSGKLPVIKPHRAAMILYTSGTTNLPKGVVTTHANIQAQVTCLIKAWKWSAHDHILCVLPLHHVHGIINVVTCALWSGAKVTFLPAFDAKDIFDLFVKGSINVFMAVPTIYYKLITYWESLAGEKQSEITSALSKFRLMVSGSAALPITTLEKWKEISHHILLERYGMTEIGMAISNPYDGERRPGYIGKPLPGVKIRLTDENNTVVKGKKPGEIQIKGKNVFKEYWAKPEATVKAFTDDGWFKSGDIAIKEKGYYKILGRDSIDIIKSGGYKISALEIEDVLRKYHSLKDCSVIGIPDPEWGEKIAVALIADEKLNLDELNTWIRTILPGYKIPRLYKIVDDLPRNAMGKVTKNELKKLFI